MDASQEKISNEDILLASYNFLELLIETHAKMRSHSDKRVRAEIYCFIRCERFSSYILLFVVCSILFRVITLSKYKVHCQVKHCNMLYSYFDDDTSIALTATFFLYTNNTFTRHHLFCKILKSISSRRKRGIFPLPYADSEPTGCEC